jgi:hypothetical protein
MESVLHDIGRRRIADAITKAHRGTRAARGGESPRGGMPGKLTYVAQGVPILFLLFSLRFSNTY